MVESSRLKNKIKENSPTLVFAFFLVLFFINSVYLAFNLKRGIIPDEPAHFIFSKHFSTTWGIPPDTYETYSWGWYIEQNPFLYHWVNGRIINATQFVFPTASDWTLLIVLRVTNVLFSLGTIIMCYLISVELIKNKWWQILPVYLLINTLMFLFLSSGVNYDNLANLFCAAGLYFFIRVFTRNNFQKNSLAWALLIGLGCLVKYTILPLALAMGLAWGIYLIKNWKKVISTKINTAWILILAVLTLIIMIWNFSIYGINLIRYQSLRPPCKEILLESQCALSPYKQRNQELANIEKLTIQESIEQGYPSPIRYTAIDWVQNMLLRTFGMIGHKSYFPLRIIGLLQALFYGMLILSIYNFLKFRPFSELNISLLWIMVFYSTVLLVTNYTSELLFNFLHISFQGRYIFPIIGIIYPIYTKILKATSIKALKIFLLLFTISLFFYGGLFTLFKGYNTFLVDWFR